MLLIVSLFSVIGYSKSFSDTNKKDSNISVHITVIDAKTKAVLPFASLLVLDKNIQVGGVQTDLEGKALIELPTSYLNKQVIIKAYYAGYTTTDQILTVKLSGNNLTIVMTSNVKVIIDYIYKYSPSPILNTDGWGKQTWRKGDTPIY